MSSETPSTPTSESTETPGNLSLDPFAEFRRLNIEAARINVRAISESLFPTDNTTNEMLGTVLAELKEMKETVNEMKIEQGNQKEALATLQRNVASLNCLPDIKRQFFGKWGLADNENISFSAKFEDGHFFMKVHNWNSFRKYTLGVKHQNGTMTTVENNKLVQRNLTNNGEETRRDEYHFENERIFQVMSKPGKANITWTYERIGDPDSE